VREIDEPSIEYLGVLFFLLLPLFFILFVTHFHIRRSDRVALRTIARQTFLLAKSFATGKYNNVA